MPKRKKNFVRRLKLSTFIYSNGLSFRVVDINSKHQNFIKKFGCLYSTSANITKQSFDKNFAIKSSDIVVYNKDGFSQEKSSSIYKITNTKTKRIR